jgi:hypothetical protein
MFNNLFWKLHRLWDNVEKRGGDWRTINDAIRPLWAFMPALGRTLPLLIILTFLVFGRYISWICSLLWLCPTRNPFNTIKAVGSWINTNIKNVFSSSLHSLPVSAAYQWRTDEYIGGLSLFTAFHNSGRPRGLPNVSVAHVLTTEY